MSTENIFVPGISSGSLIAGYMFERMGSSASFGVISYVAFIAFLVQLSVSRLIMRMSKPTENAIPDERTTKELATCPENMVDSSSRS